jgi:ArsR family transcriptional regulator
MKGPNLVSLLQALGDRTRLRLLNLIATGEVCVCWFVELLEEPQPKISRHLAYLRRVGLVSARRDGKWIHYSLAMPADEAVARVLEATLISLASDRQMQRDRAALVRCCDPARSAAALQHAPRPQLNV